MPVIENLKNIRDTQTNRSFACTAVDIAMPQDWRTAIQPAVTRHGGIDAHAGSNDYLSPRAITTTLVHRYLPGETFKTVSFALESVITRGNPLELTFIEEDGTAWLFENVRLTKYEKKMNKDMAVLCTIPLAFIAPDPRQRALYAPGRLLLDNGLFLNNGFLLNDDPSTFDLTIGTSTSKDVFNTGSASDDAPIVVFQGTIGGALNFRYYDDAGNVTGWDCAPAPGGYVVQAGETLTVDAEQLEVVSSLGTDPYARFSPLPGQEGWGRIASGHNGIYIIYGGVAPPASCTLRWSPRK